MCRPPSATLFPYTTLFRSERANFIAGCARENKIPEKKANAIFDLLEKFAGYGFNKSHSAAYGLISRSEEHTSELQSRQYLVCRLLLEKQKEHEAAAKDYLQ